MHLKIGDIVTGPKNINLVVVAGPHSSRLNSLHCYYVFHYPDMNMSGFYNLDICEVAITNKIWTYDPEVYHLAKHYLTNTSLKTVFTYDMSQLEDALSSPENYFQYRLSVLNL